MIIKKTLAISSLGVFLLLTSWVWCAEGAESLESVTDATRTSQGAPILLRGQQALRLSERRTAQATRPNGASQPEASKEVAATRAVLTPQRGDSESVDSVAVSPDGRLILSGGEDRRVRLWDVATGALIRTFKGHSAPVGAVAFSPDGRIVVSGSADQTVRLWKAASGELVHEFKTGGSVTSVAFSPDGRRVLSASTDGVLGLWDPGSGQLIRKFGADEGTILFAVFSPDGRRIASRAAPGQRLLLWDATSGALTREIRVDPSWHGLAFSPDGGRIAAGSGDELRLFDTKTGASVRTLTSSPRSDAPHVVAGENRGWNISSVAFSPDGRRLMFRGAMFDVATARPVHTFDDVIISKFSVGEISFAPAAFTPDGRGIVTGLYGELCLWDSATGAVIRKIKGYQGYHSYDYAHLTHFAAFSADGRQVMSAGITPPRIWDLDSGALVREVRDIKGDWTFAFSPDGRRLASVLRSSASGSTLELRDAASRSSPTREIAVSVNAIKSVAFSPDGQRMLVSDGSSGLQLVNASDGAAMIAISLPPDVQRVPSDGLPKSLAAYAPAPVAFSPDGRRILSGGRLVDRDLLERPFAREAAVLWSPDERRKVSVFPGPVGPITAGAFSSDGKRVVSGSMDGMLRLWNAGYLLPGKAFKGHSGAVMSVAFSPDGRRIVSGGEDNAVRLWEVDTGELVHEFMDHADPVTSVAFSRDGRRILSAGMDGSWRMWDGESFAPVMTMQALPDFEWIVEFPDGHYRATDGASRSLVVVNGVKTLPMGPYERTFRLSTPIPSDAR